MPCPWARAVRLVEHEGTAEVVCASLAARPSVATWGSKAVDLAARRDPQSAPGALTGAERFQRPLIRGRRQSRVETGDENMRKLLLLAVLVGGCAGPRAKPVDVDKVPAHVQEGGHCKSVFDCKEGLECMIWSLTPGSGTCQRECEETSDCPSGELCGSGAFTDGPTKSFCTPPGVSYQGECEECDGPE